MALPAFAQTATDPNPANPSAVVDGTPAAGTGSGAAPGKDPAASGKTGATLGNQAPSQGPGPMGETANPGPSSGQNSESSMGAPAAGSAPSSASGDQTPPASDTPAKPRHHSMRSSSSTGESGHWAHQPGTGESGPASSQASNIDGADTHATIAPHLPSPGLGENASPDKYLMVAERALRAHKSGEAQQALEMAETRLLDRSTSPSAASSPDQGPRVQAVSAALRDLAAKDWKGAHRSILEAMNTGDHGGGAMGAEGGAMGGGVGSGGDASQASGVANTSTSTNVTVQGQGSGYNAGTGHPGANPAPLAGTVNRPGTMGAAGVNNPGAPAAPNPANPANETK
jgi:hypothetical protein